MPPTLLEVSEQARQLSPDEKAILCSELQSQLAEPNPEIQQLWIEEVKRRIAAHRLNPEPTYSHEEVMADLLEP